MWKDTVFRKDEACGEFRLKAAGLLTCNLDECCSVVSEGFEVQL